MLYVQCKMMLCRFSHFAHDNAIEVSVEVSGASQLEVRGASQFRVPRLCRVDYVVYIDGMLSHKNTETKREGQREVVWRLGFKVLYGVL